ncbi:MAG TPA: HD domain-containing phosphohydrolase [Humisphaera sp.]
MLHLSHQPEDRVAELTRLAEERDAETAGHLDRVCAYSRILAGHLAADRRYGRTIDDAFVDRLGRAAALHDVGKADVPDVILLKPAPLTPIEASVMRRHTTLGARTLERSLADHPDPAFRDLAVEIAETHHERWDGRGYPLGLRGTDIPLGGRIVALADVYDALTSKRAYKEAFPHAEARKTILAGRGGHFDPAVVDAFAAGEQAFVRAAAAYADRASKAA